MRISHLLDIISVNASGEKGNSHIYSSSSIHAKKNKSKNRRIPDTYILEAETEVEKFALSDLKMSGNPFSTSKHPLITHRSMEQIWSKPKHCSSLWWWEFREKANTEEHSLQIKCVDLIFLDYKHLYEKHSN